MIWAVVAMAFALVGATATTIVYAVKYVRAAKEADYFKLDGQRLEKVLHDVSMRLSDESRRQRAMIKELKYEITTLYDELSICGDDDTRGALAITALRRMLPKAGALDRDDETPTLPKRSASGTVIDNGGRFD